MTYKQLFSLDIDDLIYAHNDIFKDYLSTKIIRHVYD